MFYIGCVIYRYRISEGSKTFSGDLQYIIIAMKSNCVISVWLHGNMQICKILSTFLKQHHSNCLQINM